ncbi:N-6 DNA methylase [Scytonema sp. UIC 10036]|uniref:N-6 DNA methylase n=1 Tax=Scytonema sp. UIC 10036 TaxID=2304196 RepID=UPI0012DAC6BB
MEWIEEIPPGRFYLRVGLGRKASGSYYTPHSFVRFLVKETLEPPINERSPKEDPKPGEILKLKVLDPAMGSGHFLVEACRFLGEKLYEACRLCDELALEAEQQAENSEDVETRNSASQRAKIFRQRVIDLPDPNDKLMKYLPSAAPEGEETGFSQAEAIALCRRLVAVHCLYGVDKNPLAVELAKLSLWLESHAEGLL